MSARRAWLWVLMAGTVTFSAHMVLELVAAHTDSDIPDYASVITGIVGYALLPLGLWLFIGQEKKESLARHAARDEALTAALGKICRHLRMPAGPGSVTQLPQRHDRAG